MLSPTPCADGSGFFLGGAVPDEALRCLPSHPHLLPEGEGARVAPSKNRCVNVVARTGERTRATSSDGYFRPRRDGAVRGPSERSVEHRIGSRPSQPILIGQPHQTASVAGKPARLKSYSRCCMQRASSRIPLARSFWRRRVAGWIALVIRIDASASRIPRDRPPLPQGFGSGRGEPGVCATRAADAKGLRRGPFRRENVRRYRSGAWPEPR